MTWPETTDSPAYLYEFGLTAAAMSYHTAAIEALRDCTALAPDHAPAWRKLAELLRLTREDAQADAAEAVALASSDSAWKNASAETRLSHLKKAERALLQPLLSKTEQEVAMALRERLVSDPMDAVAMRWLARLEARTGDRATARALFERALQLCPSYTDAREDYAQLLIDGREYAAIEETKRLLADEPSNPRYRYLHAHASMDAGRLDATIQTLTKLLRADPHNAQYWLLYGAALRATGRREETVQAYRKCLEMQPDMGEAYWGLAELKDRVLTQNDIDAMHEYLEDNALASENRMRMLYALGQALERAGDFGASFRAYEEAASEFWTIEKKNPRDEELTRDHVSRVRRIKRVFSRENIDKKLVQAPAADSDDTPIFVIGLPRAGSTLVEQILSAHSLVEAIGERSLIGDIARDLAISRMLVDRNVYPDCLLELSQDRLTALGARVIENSRNYRASRRPCFVDKRPWNWFDVGLIHLILPQAKIIDIRREPMAACFAMYKQMLPTRSCAFSYDLQELGCYYNTYVDLMDHWKTTLPGRVHYLQYERLVDDTEMEIRRMLDYCGLPFEENCLRFWETDRTIVTPSAEQVRRPIYRDALQQWRNFEPWLGPLKESLCKPVES